MKKFNFEESPLPGVFHITRKPIMDTRGYFERVFCEEEFSDIGLTKRVVNINHSYTKLKGTIRGLHFQYPPFAETKIVMCTKGSVFDVAVDIRKESPTFLKWHSRILSADNHNMLFIPEGFAHGFQTLEEDTEIIYLNTNFYSQKFEAGLAYDDPTIGISWALEPVDISEKDKTHPWIKDEFVGVER